MKSLKRGLCAALAVMLSLSFAACGDRPLKEGAVFLTAG